MARQPAGGDWDFTPRQGDGKSDDPTEALLHVMCLLHVLAREVDIDPEAALHAPSRTDKEPHHWKALDEFPVPLHDLAKGIHHLAERLDRILIDRSIPPFLQPVSFNRSRTVIVETLFAGRKAVHLGFVERYLTVPLSPPLSRETYAYLSRVIPGESDKLVPENHGSGWHYHYCDRSERRSDTIMSFDARRLKKLGAVDMHPLSSEPHGVKKATFSARPWTWGDKKRTSIYGACAPDLEKKKAAAFKTPSQNAEDVWPR
jgi:hypothetical protein